MAKTHNQNRNKHAPGHRGTQETVLDAARRVFSRHPYNAASIRMIAQEGGFGHAIIGYYFPTKAELFNRVTEDLCNDLETAAAGWVAETRSMPLSEGFARYVSRLTDFSREKPWVLRIMMLNISREEVGGIPGQERVLEVIEGIREQFVQTMRLNAPAGEICRFSDSLNALGLYYLGAPESAAWLLRMDPDSDEYFDWVKTTIHTLFLPALARLFAY